MEVARLEEAVEEEICHRYQGVEVVEEHCRNKSPWYQAHQPVLEAYRSLAVAVHTHTPPKDSGFHRRAEVEVEERLVAMGQRTTG